MEPKEREELERQAYLDAFSEACKAHWGTLLASLQIVDSGEQPDPLSPMTYLRAEDNFREGFITLRHALRIALDSLSPSKLAAGEGLAPVGSGENPTGDLIDASP